MNSPEDSRQTLNRIRRRTSFVLLLFVAVVSIKVSAVQWLALGGGSATGVLLDAVFVFVFFAAVDLFFADMRFRALLIGDALVSLLLTVVVIYHSYYGLLPNRESLALIRQATTVGGSIATLLNPLYLLLFADIPAFMWWVVRSRRRGLDPATGRRPGVLIVPGLRTPYVYQWRTVYFVAAAAAFAFGLSVQAARGGAEATDSAAVARDRGVMTYVSAALVGPNQRVQAAGTLTGDGLQARIRELSSRESTAPLAGFTPGMAAGSNVIILQVEALQSIAVGQSVGGMAVTPNLDALIGQSWYYPNCVSAAGVGTTADVEFATNTSLYPPSEVGASLGWSDRQLTSMPRTLNALGYESYTFHTNEVGFWNRSQFYPAVGFTRYFDRAYFGTEDKMAFNSASDRVLLEKTLPQLENTRRAGKPFYAQIIMMSSHFPFENVPSDRRKLRPGAPYEGNIVGNYLTEINYVDEQIGYFVSQLKQSGLWDESIVVVYGDHFGLPDPRSGSEAQALRALAGHDYNDADKALVPLIVHLPGQTDGATVTVPVGQVDLTPTLADALDVDLSGMVHFGRSVLRSGGGVIAASGLLGRGSYVDESVLYVPGGEFDQGKVFDIRTGERLTISAASEDRFESVKELILLSRDYVATLPLREDFNPDAEISFPRKR